MHAFIPSRIVSSALIGDHVRNIIVEPEAWVPYEAGQFFILRLRDQQGEYVERSYSIANFSAEKKYLEFVIRVSPEGHFSPLIDKMKSGEMLDIKGPFGRFGFASPHVFQKLVLIAGGVGIAPIRGMIQKSFLLQEQYPIQLFYGFRKTHDFLFQEELERYGSDPRFSIVTSISNPSTQGSTLNKGYITHYLEGSLFPPAPDVACFLCGPPGMVKDTREKLVQLGFDRKQIHLEAW